MRGNLGKIVEDSLTRGHDGVFLAAGAGALTGLSFALHAESVACMKGLEVTAFIGMQNVMIEIDAAILKTTLISQEYDLFALIVFKEIKSRMFSEFACVLCLNLNAKEPVI